MTGLDKIKKDLAAGKYFDEWLYAKIISRCPENLEIKRGKCLGSDRCHECWEKALKMEVEE